MKTKLRWKNTFKVTKDIPTNLHIKIVNRRAAPEKKILVIEKKYISKNTMSCTQLHFFAALFFCSVIFVKTNEKNTYGIIIGI